MFISQRNDHNIKHVSKKIAQGHEVHLRRNDANRAGWEWAVVKTQADLDALLADATLTDLVLKLNGKPYHLVKCAGVLA